MIQTNMNVLGMVAVSCNHVKGYKKGKGKNICNRCARRVCDKIQRILTKW